MRIKELFPYEYENSAYDIDYKKLFAVSYLT
jgi:hypothetical protein